MLEAIEPEAVDRHNLHIFDSAAVDTQSVTDTVQLRPSEQTTCRVQDGLTRCTALDLLDLRARVLV